MSELASDRPQPSAVVSKIDILPANKEALEQYASDWWGKRAVVLSKEHIDALLAGKMLAWNDGEYSTFVLLTP